MTAVPSTVPAFVPSNTIMAVPPRPPALLPSNFKEAMQLADVMSYGKLVPVHLQGNSSDCLAVIMQAIRWQCDPFAVAQCTSVIGGKLMYEGKLTMAVVNTSGKLHGRLNFRFEGEGDAREVVCFGRIIGDAEPSEVRVKLKDARTNNRMWNVQPDQQLCYHSARVWARRYMPEVMLGIYSPEEFPEQGDPAIEQQRQNARANIQRTIDQDRATPLIELKTPGDQGGVSFPKTKAGVEAALKHLADFPALVLLNLDWLSMVEDRMPQMAAKVSEVRSSAALALAPEDDDFDYPGKDAGAEVPEPAVEG